MRARNLKPALFKNELLATSDPLYTLIFEGLWCIADRAGRLEDRPRRIHLEINAGRAYEGTEGALAWLAQNAFIVRYTLSGTSYIQIVNFEKHQNPHVREPASIIPEPRASTIQAPGIEANIDNEKPGTSTVPARNGHESGPADSSFLTPDPPSLTALSPREISRTPKRARPAKICPADFEVTEDLRKWAAQKFPSVDVDAETEAFREFEFRRAYSNWPAVWRRWIKTAFERGNQPGAQRQPERKLTRYEQLHGTEDVEIVD